jgi:sialic acid synthase SpsE
VFHADELVATTAPKAAYQEERTGAGESQLAMLRRLELGEADFRKLADHGRGAGVKFLATPFDLRSLRFLANDLKLPTIKIGSGDLTNAPLLLEAAKLGRDVILSTGMSTMQEVGEALGALACGYTGGKAPGPAAFTAALASAKGRAALKRHVAVLHCVSQYPAPVAEINLRAMDSLRESFGLDVGYSDHTEDLVASLAAVSRGAQLIEKHLTLDKNLPGPDHRASLEPAEFASLVRQIRAIEKALGNGHKAPQPSEADTRRVARRSLGTLKPVRKGEPFTADNLGVLRPATGISPMRYWEWLGKPADRAYQAGELIEE